MNQTKPKQLSQVYPWVVIIIASFILFYKYLLQVFPSVITTQLMTDFQLTGAGLGNLAACFFYSYLIVQFFSGYLVDRFNMKLVICCSILISALGAFVFSLADSYTVVSIGRILMGAGAAFATVGYMKTAAIYFPPQRFALVSGLLTVGVMLGAVFGEAPLALLIQDTGWPHALMVIGIIGIVISVLFYCVVQNKPKLSHTVTSSDNKRLTAKDIRAILSKPTNWYLTLYSGLAFAPLAVFGGLWGTPFIARAYHLTHAHAAAYVSIVYIGFGIGGPILGYFSDRFRIRFRLMALGLVLSFITLAIIIYFTPTSTWLIILTLLFGFGTGAFMLGFSVGKDLNSFHVAATVIALINSGDAICGALSEPLIGKILDITSGHQPIPAKFTLNNYHVAFITLMVELVIAGLFLKLAQRSSKKQASLV